jgi:ribosomal protein S18 acetylase RimI-like enzyme
VPLGAAGGLSRTEMPMRGLQIVAPDAVDWKTFLTWAAAEGWRVPSRELEIYAGSASGEAFVLKADLRPLGFVTAVAHQRSGWIGNLLVPPDARGRGHGARLFDHATESLEKSGVENIWLTASAQGQPLYGRRGFRSVDRVVRWAVGGGGAVPAETGAAADLYAADRRVWGESRQALLDSVAREGRIFVHGETVLLLQAGTELQVLGPWYSREYCPRENRLVLSAALEAAGTGELVVDALASAPVAALLAAAGFEPRGECALMVRGAPPAGNFAGLVALASLGSMG